MKVTYFKVKEPNDIYTFKQLVEWLDDKLVLWYDKSIYKDGLFMVIIPDRMRMQTPKEFEHKVLRWYEKY